MGVYYVLPVYSSAKESLYVTNSGYGLSADRGEYSVVASAVGFVIKDPVRSGDSLEQQD